MLYILGIILAIAIIVLVVESKKAALAKAYRELETNALKDMGLDSWDEISLYDELVIVKSRAALDKYDQVKFFKENAEKLQQAQEVLERKSEIKKILNNFLLNNTYKTDAQYPKLRNRIEQVLIRTNAYRIKISYITSAGNNLASKEISVRQNDVERFRKNPELLMSKAEYNKFVKEQQKAALDQKHHYYYNRVNDIIDFSNKNKDLLVIKGSQEKLDNLVSKLFDRTVNSIKKIKTIDSEEWQLIDSVIGEINNEINQVVGENKKILDYYESPDFLKIKDTCENMMSSQREFNEYINEKVQSISQLFGTRIVRNDTVNEDEYSYIRPYKKTITPFTAEVSSTVFASAENSPLEYVVKYFYPNKDLYPEQIKKLQHLVGELETLKEAKQIIDNYKSEYRQYLGDVPAFVMENDECGFYSRLGFANVDESTLTVEYKFVYTSGGGMAQRSFTIPMTEETIVKLIEMLEGKLTVKAFAKEQRAMMTKKLREHIKERDGFTCCSCGNSTKNEPNLLLEIDHIIPVAKGGCTVEENLQTLCWKCNRAKSDKLI